MGKSGGGGDKKRGPASLVSSARVEEARLDRVARTWTRLLSAACSQQLYDAIVSQKLQQVRWGVANAGVAPGTRDPEGNTTFMIACLNGKDRSLAEMVRWYERRLSQLRECLDQQHEDDGRTCFHMAAAHPNGAKCVSELLDAWLTVDKKPGINSGLKRRDGRGKTPYDVATPKARAIIDEWLREPETASEDEAVGEDGLTSTQRSKAKKRAMAEKERAGAAPPPPPTAAEAAEAERPERGEFRDGQPTPQWPECEKWAQSVRDLKPICELTIARDAELPELPPAGPGEPATCVDPALFWCETVNRLSLKLGPQLAFLSPHGLAKLGNLTHLIIPGHSLTELPATLAKLPLKSLDCARNKLAALPEMPTSLEALDVSGNALTSVSPALDVCVELVTLQCDANQIASLELPFGSFKRLVTLTAGANKLESLPEALGDAAKLEALTVNGNPMTALPCSLARCKKLKDVKVDACPIKDNKVLGYIQKGEYKQLAKYFEKTASKSGGGGGGKGKKGKKK